MTLMSSRLTPSPSSPGTAVITQAAAKSISPRASIGSRTCGCTFDHCTRAGSTPVMRAKTLNKRYGASTVGAPPLRPMRSAGFSMPAFLSEIRLSGA